MKFLKALGKTILQAGIVFISVIVFLVFINFTLYLNSILSTEYMMAGVTFIIFCLLILANYINMEDK